jgi:hypothetical protein
MEKISKIAPSIVKKRNFQCFVDICIAERDWVCFGFGKIELLHKP